VSELEPDLRGDAVGVEVAEPAGDRPDALRVRGSKITP
jgi:hypothetical protein